MYQGLIDYHKSDNWPPYSSSSMNDCALLVPLVKTRTTRTKCVNEGTTVMSSYAAVALSTIAVLRGTSFALSYNIDINDLTGIMAKMDEVIPNRIQRHFEALKSHVEYRRALHDAVQLQDRAFFPLFCDIPST